MLGFIPVLGPIIEGIINLFIKKQDVQIEKVKADVTNNQTAASITIATKDDLGVKVIRDVVLIGPAVWTCLCSWDTIVALHWPELMFHVASFPPGLEWLPYATMTFLLGIIWKK